MKADAAKIEDKTIRYVKGDATLPIFIYNQQTNITDTAISEIRCIIHICNDINRWGKGFVVCLGDRYPEAKMTYLKSVKQTGYHDLGTITHVKIDNTLMVINMVAQKGITKDRGGIPPIRYVALKECLIKTRNMLETIQAQEDLLLDSQNTYNKVKISIHMPKIGCGLAGGDWDVIKELITSELVIIGQFDCVVYTLDN